jgi:ankyrin repeat protein
MKKYFKKAIYLAVFTASFSLHAGSFDDFFRAARSDDAGSIAALLNRGFDPNTRDEQGQTGLLIAMREPSPKTKAR